MSRPETINDVKDRYIEFATFDVDKITAAPKLLKCYTALIEQVLLQAGKVDTQYSSRVVLALPRNKKQLEEQLRSDQYSWDSKQKDYQKLLRGEEVSSYRIDTIREWAKEEGLADPQPDDVEVT